MNYDPKPKCALCPKEAITTAAHIPVCGEHHQQYQEEGRQYLPTEQRAVYRRLIEAAEREATLWE